MISKEFVNEARKNPEKNPKVSVNSAIEKWVNVTSDHAGSTMWRNVFVSFTDLEKLGINPKSKYNTPLGIYSYPAEYILETTEKLMPMTVLPFAGDSPWANIFKSKGNIIPLDTMPEFLCEVYYDKLRPYKPKGIMNLYQRNSDIIDELIREGETAALKSNLPGGIFWYVTMECAKIIAKQMQIEVSLAWNWLFRKIEIDGFTDTAGIIHENEPTQAVFFSTKSVELLERVANKYNPLIMGDVQKQGREQKEKFERKISELRRLIQDGDLKKIIDWLDTDDNREYIKYIPRDLRAEILKLKK